MKNVQLNVAEFHPELRNAISGEFARLADIVPIFGKHDVRIIVAESHPCQCGECPNTTLDNSFAVTSLDVHELHHSITFSQKLFGTNGDLNELQRLLSAGGAESFNNPGYVVAHEYGHIIEAMLMETFGTDEKEGPNTSPVGVAFKALINQVWEDVHPITATLIQAGLHVPPYNAKGEHKGLVSRYAYSQRDEFFAETFAAIHWGNDDQKSLPTVQRMRELIAVAQIEVSKLERNGAQVN